MRRNPLEWLAEAMMTITTIPILAMMVHVTLDVVLKYTLNLPFQGTLEVTAYYYMVSVVVLPMAIVEMTRHSIAVDLFYQMLPRGLQVVITGMVLLLSALGYGILAWVSFPDAIRSFEMREIVMGTVQIYVWPARFMLPFALAVTTLVCLLLFFRLLFVPQYRDELVNIHTIDPNAEAS